jgi:hypothetical protein
MIRRKWNLRRECRGDPPKLNSRRKCVLMCSECSGYCARGKGTSGVVMRCEMKQRT